MLKILQARLQQYVNRELPHVQAGFIYLFIYLFIYFFRLDLEKAEEPEIKLPMPIGLDHRKKREFQKISTSALLVTPQPLTVWITTNCGKF